MTGFYPCQQAEDRPAAGLAAVQGAHGLNNDADKKPLSSGLQLDRRILEED